MWIPNDANPTFVQSVTYFNVICVYLKSFCFSKASADPILFPSQYIYPLKLYNAWWWRRAFCWSARTRLWPPPKSIYLKTPTPVTRERLPLIHCFWLSSSAIFDSWIDPASSCTQLPPLLVVLGTTSKKTCPNLSAREQTHQKTLQGLRPHTCIYLRLPFLSAEGGREGRVRESSRTPRDARCVKATERILIFPT